MSINPSGRRSSDDFWSRKSKDDSDKKTETSSSSSPNLGRHAVSTSSIDTKSQGNVSSLREKLAKFFGAGNVSNLSGSTEHSSRPLPPSPTPISSSGDDVSMSQSSGARPKQAHRPPKTGSKKGSSRAPRSDQKVGGTDQESKSSSSFDLNQFKAGLKEVAAKQTQATEDLNRISEKVRSRWSKWEKRSPVDYKISGYNILRKTLLTIRNERYNRMEKKSRSLPGLVNTSLATVEDVVQQALLDATTFKIDEMRDGTGLQLLACLAVEGPLLAPSESIKDFLRSRASDLGADTDSPKVEELIQTLGSSIDSVRKEFPRHMPKVWESLINHTLDTTIRMKHKTAVYNVGKVNRNNVDSMTRRSEQYLNSMKTLSTPVWSNTMVVLISDLFSYGDS